MGKNLPITRGVTEVSVRIDICPYFSGFMGYRGCLQAEDKLLHRLGQEMAPGVQPGVGRSLL